MHGVTARFRWHSTCLILLACQRMLTDAMVLKRLPKTAELTHPKRQDPWRAKILGGARSAASAIWVFQGFLSSCASQSTS